jgi:chemotaxis protein methyltransferase CheR
MWGWSCQPAAEPDHDRTAGRGDERQFGLVVDRINDTDVQQVQEVVRPQPITPVPLAPKVVRGLINLRGQILTAIDLRHRLGLGELSDRTKLMNVVVRTDESPVSFLVDEIGEVLDVDESSFEAPPELLNEVTIGETCLFRSPPQLTALQNVIPAPELIATRSKIGLRKIRLRKIRIWSAGCSTGEEPYTLSMFLLEQTEKLLKGWNFEIAATDLNDRSIETAKAGIYGGYALRNTTDLYKRKYFTPADGDKLRVTDEVKSRITFSRVNLSDDTKMLFMKGMHLIFCCNVLIYFDVVSKRRVVQHFFSSLQPPGYFFLGHAESLYQVTDQFRLVHLPGTTTYLKAALGSEGTPKP